MLEISLTKSRLGQSFLISGRQTSIACYYQQQDTHSESGDRVRFIPVGDQPNTVFDILLL